MNGATAQGTARCRDRAMAGGAVPLHFRMHRGLSLSSVGLGTYLGEADDATDTASEAALREALAAGVNVLDSAINYRHQRSERVIGRVLSETPRDEIFLTTKGGFLPFDGEMPRDGRRWLEKTYILSGLVPAGEVAGGMHCMAPGWLKHQLGRSLANLGVDAVDGYFIHNPETQLRFVARPEFERRLSAAFAALEEEAAAGRLGQYGVATWSGLRAEAGAAEWLDLAGLLGLARRVAGDGHHFGVIQLPINLAMPEAGVLHNQAGRTVLQAAVDAGLLVLASGSLMQGRLASGLPQELRDLLPGVETDAQRALQFTRSLPGVGVALAGMKSRAHVRENLALARVNPLSPEQIGRIL